jgi:hypothetical protein
VRKDCLNVALIGAVFVLTACSEAPKPAASETKSEPETKKAAETAGPISAKTAFWEMYKLVHAWAPDVAPLSMVSKAVPGIKNGAGKAGMWTAAFVSPSLRQARILSYSVVAAPPSISKVWMWDGRYPGVRRATRCLFRSPTLLSIPTRHTRRHSRRRRAG